MTIQSSRVPHADTLTKIRELPRFTSVAGVSNGPRVHPLQRHRFRHVALDMTVGT